MTHSSFTALAGEAVPELDQLLLALAAEFHPTDRPGAERVLDRLAGRLPDALPRRAADQALACAAVVGGQAGFRAGRGQHPDALLLDRVLERRSGHPALLASIYVMVAGRAGIPLVLVAGRDHWMVVHAGAQAPVVLDPSRPQRLLRPDEVPAGLRCLCPHQVAFMLLERLRGIYALHGETPGAMRAAELQLHLPVTSCRTRLAQSARWSSN